MKNFYLALLLPFLFSYAFAGEKEGIAFFEGMHESFGFSSADGVNVCFCGNYGALYDAYYPADAGISKEALDNRIAFQES